MIPLSDFTDAEIRSAVCISPPASTAYVDGNKINRLPNGLHKVHGCFLADLHNATHGNSVAMSLLKMNGYITP